MEAADQQQDAPAWTNWLLWAIPVTAVAYLTFLLAMGFGWIPTVAYPLSTWVFFGTGLLATLLVVGVVLLLRTSPAPASAKKRAKRAQGGEDAEAPPEAPSPPAASEPHREDPALAEWDDEVVLTDDRVGAVAVAEYSRPAKSRAGDAIYAKTHVEVEEDLLLRVEDKVAERRTLL